jgi:hypothetical protein
LKRGANPDLPEDNRTPLKLAAQLENKEIEKLLKDAGAKE